MVAERQGRYPRGTYKVLFVKQPGGDVEYCMINLATGMRCHSFSIWNLLKSIESDISTNRFPQGAIQYRTWGVGASPVHGDRVTSFAASLANDCSAGFSEAGGPTFIISVLYRQNATWQGTIQWMEGRQTRQYRSVNEMLSLMDDASTATFT